MSESEQGHALFGLQEHIREKPITISHLRWSLVFTERTKVKEEEMMLQ